MAESVLLAAAWREALASLGVGLTGSVLLAGGDIDGLARAAGAPVRQETGTIVTLGSGDVPLLDEEATATATTAPEGSFDAVVALAAWDGPAALTAVAAEAARIVRPGCPVWLGDLDAETLVEATPAVHLEALLYRAHPEAAKWLVASHQPSSRLALAAMAAGLLPTVVDSVRLPVAAYATAGDHIEAVRAGAWPGWHLLDGLERDEILTEMKERLDDVDFPLVARRPWLLAHGPRRR